MAIKEIPANKKNRMVRIAQKVKATKFSVGPEYKFVFKIESTTSHSWRTFFAESLPKESRILLKEVRQERKARYTPVFFHRSELDIICNPVELSSILNLIKEAIQQANEKDAEYRIQLAEAEEKKELAWKLAKEQETNAENKIQKFFAKLEL